MILMLTISESGNLYAFGNNGENQLGVDDINNSLSPVRVECEPRKYTALAAGADHSVALTGEALSYTGVKEFQIASKGAMLTEGFNKNKNKLCIRVKLT